jgi:hypothetical protein
VNWPQTFLDGWKIGGLDFVNRNPTFAVAMSFRAKTAESPT